MEQLRQVQVPECHVHHLGDVAAVDESGQGCHHRPARGRAAAVEGAAGDLSEAVPQPRRPAQPLLPAEAGPLLARPHGRVEVGARQLAEDVQQHTVREVRDSDGHLKLAENLVLKLIDTVTVQIFYTLNATPISILQYQYFCLFPEYSMYYPYI